MQIVTISLTDKEIKALKKVCEVRGINRHHAMKTAVREYIAHFEETKKLEKSIPNK